MFMLGAEDDTLSEIAEDSKAGRADKTLVKEGSLRITLVALKKRTVLPSHQVAGPASIQIIRGCLRLTTDRSDVDVPAGTLIALGPRGRSYRKSTYRLRNTDFVRDVTKVNASIRLRSE